MFTYYIPKKQDIFLRSDISNSCIMLALNLVSSFSFDHVTNMSSTYMHIIILFFSLESFAYTPCSDIHLINSNLMRKLLILLFQTIGTCFNPYIVFINLYILTSCPLISNPSSCFTQTFSTNIPIREGYFTYKICIFHPLYVSTETTILMV